MSDERVEGWAAPVNSRKFHWFRDSRSLCGKYGLFAGMQSDVDPEVGERSPDDCAGCRRKLDAEAPR